jgi:diguanylate cyclase (GGDEF)-like protein
MNGNPLNIMLLEDNQGDARLIQELLRDVNGGCYQLSHVQRLSEGKERLRQEKTDVVLLDLGLPDCSGLDSLTRLNGLVDSVPVIVLTGLDDEAVAVAAVQAGAQDYLVKGQVDGNLLWRSMRYAIERKQLEQKLAYIATHDSLTGLPNRVLLNDRLSLAITQIERKDRRLAVMMLDLDGFKNVNDTFGHGEGDELLKACAERLTSVLRKGDTVARLGGDEFIVLLSDISSIHEAAVIAARILGLFRESFVLDRRVIDITTSIGIAVYPEHGADIETLMKNADTAMYLVKGNGRCNFAFFGMQKDNISAT